MDIPGHADTKFQRYLMLIGKERLALFAKRADTSIDAIKVNLRRPVVKPYKDHKKNHPCKSQPSSGRMMKLSRATLGKCSYEDMLDHFYRA